MQKSKLLKYTFFLLIIIGLIISLLKDYIKKYAPDWIWVLLPIVIIVVILFFVVSIKIGRTLKRGGREAEELRGPVHKTILVSSVYQLAISTIIIILLFLIVYKYIGFNILSPYTLFFLGLLIVIIGFSWFLVVITKKEYFAPEKGSVYEEEQKKKIMLPNILMVIGAILTLVAILFTVLSLSF